MGIVLNKCFLLDSQPFTEPALGPFNKLYDLKKDKIKMFYTELIDLPDMKSVQLDEIFNEQATTKFQYHSMCLRLETIKVLYKFFGTYKQEFSQKSKQSVSVLTDDIDYMNKDAQIFDSPSQGEA